MTRAIKGFDANLQCRGFQFTVGETYTHEGAVKVCRSGFHATPEDAHPLSVFEYYPPAGSRFCIVEIDGKADRGDNKIAAEILTVSKEIGLGGLAQEAVAWVMARAKPERRVTIKANGLATASGYQGAATASGDTGAATASGTRGAATASGTQGAATASGTQGSNSMATGFKGKVKGCDGAGLYAVERATWDGPIMSSACGIVGREGIKADVWYCCKGGTLVEEMARTSPDMTHGGCAAPKNGLTRKWRIAPNAAAPAKLKATP